MTFFSHHGTDFFYQLLNTTLQFRAPFPYLLIISSFCAPLNNFTHKMLPHLRDIYSKFRFLTPYLGLRPGAAAFPCPLVTPLGSNANSQVSVSLRLTKFLRWISNDFSQFNGTQNFRDVTFCSSVLAQPVWRIGPFWLSLFWRYGVHRL